MVSKVLHTGTKLHSQWLLGLAGPGSQGRQFEVVHLQISLMGVILGWALVPAVKADSSGSFLLQIAFQGMTLGWALVPAIKADSLGSSPLQIVFQCVTLGWALVSAVKADSSASFPLQVAFQGVTLGWALFPAVKFKVARFLIAPTSEV